MSISLGIGLKIGGNGGGQSWEDYYTNQLANRMAAAGDTVSTAEKSLMQSAIGFLLNNHLGCNYFEKLDCLWITNSRVGRASAKLNWIKDLHNLTEQANGGTLTYNSGFASDGTNSYLSTNYNPTNNGVYYTLNSASFGVRTSGALGTSDAYSGHGCTGLFFNKYGTSNNRSNTINGIGGFGIGLPRTIQMQSLSYSTATGAKQYSRYPTANITSGSLVLCNEEVTLVAIKSTTSGMVQFCASTEVLEAAYIGSYLTQDENDYLNSIIDGYIRGIERIEGNAMSFSTDDSYATNYSIIYPLLVLKSAHASIHVITSYIGNAGRNTWAELVTMKAAGFDIGDHSVDHAYYTTLNDTQLTAEFEGVNTAFVANGLTAPRHGAYPYSDYNDTVKVKAALYRDTMRGGAFQYVTSATDKYTLQSIDISACQNSMTGANMGAILDYIDGCMTEIDKHILLFAHEAKAGDTDAGNKILGVNQLERILDYVKAIGMVILSQEELYEQKLT